MSSNRLPVSLPLGKNPFGSNTNDEVKHLLAMVLATPLGRMPWRPDFGCQVSDLVGETATPERLEEIRWRVEHAISSNLPEIQILKCEVRLVPSPFYSPNSDRSVPIAETALFSLGADADIEVLLDVQAEDRVISYTSELSL